MQSSSTHLLLVEDDVHIRDALTRRFKFEGFEVRAVSGGEEGLKAAQETEPDLIVLDVMLPEIDGFELLTRIRLFSNVPILMLTARDSTGDKVTGLERGADDYLVKPFDTQELLARIRSLLRRSQYLNLPNDTSVSPDERLEFAGISLERLTRSVRLEGRSIQLTPTEFDVLVHFLRHPRQVLTREQIISAVWPSGSGRSPNLVDVFVLQLRKKLERTPAERRLFTVRGVGYTLRAKQGFALPS